MPNHIYFTNKGEMRPPIQRVNVDFSVEMLRELDAVAMKLNISRQAVIKSLEQRGQLFIIDKCIFIIKSLKEINKA